MKDKRVVSVWIEAQGARWDHVRVQKLAGREAIGQLFSFDLDVACEPDHDLPEGAQIGEELSLVFDIDGDEVRRVHGIVGALRSRIGAEGDHHQHQIRVVPRAARLGLVETQEIYLGKTIPEILESKLDRQGFTTGDFEMRLVGTYAAREFVVQYGETDLAFMSRLAEHAGISFFFEHEDGHDKIVFTDHPSGFRAVPGAEEIPFRARGENHGVLSLERASEIASTSYIVQDYNYRTPQVDLSACFDLESGNGGGVVEYGAHVKTPEEAERVAKVRGEEARGRQLAYEGKSGAVTPSAGRRAQIVDIPRQAGPVPLLFTEVVHEATIPVFNEDAQAEARYVCSFRAVPSEGFTYRPPRRTPKPRIAGVITGVVQPGPDGETGGVAQIDAEGRYTIQFHFDTTQPGEQKASHPVRLAQPFAGSNYGMHMPLRRGTEVLLAFTNGDPDRPVIIGALYNATSPSPVVAANATRHQIKAPSGAVFEFGSKS
ncbi:MAG: type VI secretion system tip protein TssI/VgrG [Minicystis sp.]